MTRPGTKRLVPVDDVIKFRRQGLSYPQIVVLVSPKKGMLFTTGALQAAVGREMKRRKLHGR